MTASKITRGLLAGAASLALIGTAMAQGNPPNPAVKNAPTGAGQQSSQQTPMGTTGTPSGGATAGTSSSSGGTNMGSTGTSSGAGTSMGASSTDSSTMSASGGGSSGSRSSRRVRADRN